MECDEINTGVVPLVGGACGRKQEVGGVIDGRLGVGAVGACEVQVEGSSRVLRSDGAGDREAVAPEHRQPVLIRIPGDSGVPGHHGRHGDVGPQQDVCQVKERVMKYTFLVLLMSSPPPPPQVTLPEQITRTGASAVCCGRMTPQSVSAASAPPQSVRKRQVSRGPAGGVARPVYTNAPQPSCLHATLASCSRQLL